MKTTCLKTNKIVQKCNPAQTRYNATQTIEDKNERQTICLMFSRNILIHMFSVFFRRVRTSFCTPGNHFYLKRKPGMGTNHEKEETIKMDIL